MGTSTQLGHPYLSNLQSKLPVFSKLTLFNNYSRYKRDIESI